VSFRALYIGLGLMILGGVLQIVAILVRAAGG
jgi:hypothetical protein